MQSPFLSGLRYLAEGGQETELMYGHGFELPKFALFPLLDDAAAVVQLKAMYEAVLQVAVRHRMSVMLGGLDYRASPDWAGLLGIDAVRLADYQHRSVAFLREVAEPYLEKLPHILVSGIVGPQGDAYERNQTVTASSAEAYHGTQMDNLASAGVDLVQAMTFTSSHEAIGVIRAAQARELPIVVSFMTDSPDEPGGQRSFRQTIEDVDRATDSYALFYGINCAHPREFEPLLRDQGEWLNRIGLLRPNASAKDKVELCQIGHLERGDARELAQLMGVLAARLPNVRVLGGCCGTWDEHLDLIAGAAASV
ncbi:MAG TPA: homocysteine S-methyltransferase family protein [Sphingomicrobium sp.]|jgi:S-methylmethionine-dependent homocysteine/selenocysteine methylase